jgi:5-methylthioadenosine/S-adenosylhomocysteine deaminase
MLFTDIEYLTEDYEVKRGYVGVAGGAVAYVGSGPPPDPQAFGERYPGQGRLLVPGLYNIHAHAPMTLLRGYAESLSLQEWLYGKVFPFEALMTAEDDYYGSLLAIAEMLRFGVVSYSDMYFHDEQRIQAAAESGVKANICPGLMVFDPDTRYEDMAECATNERLVRECHGAYGGRLRIDLNIHSEYISNPQVIRSVGQQAIELGVGTHIHISETFSEHQECKQRRGGLTPTAYFESLGFFEQPCTAAHAVWTEPDDWRIFAEHGVTVAANPASNLKLASGFAPLPQMLAAGVRVGLGTDGAASNNSHNMMRDLYLMATVYKAAGSDPTLITPAEAMRAATVNGALAQGRPDCGSIALGKRADLAVLDVDVPWMKPVSSQLSNLVYAAQGSDVVLTMVDGQVLYRDGQWTTIDVEKACFEAQAATDRISAELG